MCKNRGEGGRFSGVGSLEWGDGADWARWAKYMCMSGGRIGCIDIRVWKGGASLCGRVQWW